MDIEAFIRWALHDARTVEERYTVELLVDGVMHAWNSKHKTGIYPSVEENMERDRQRRLNPAYEPSYSEVELRRGAEILAERTRLELNPNGYQSRVVRDLTALRLLPHLEEVQVSGAIDDCAIFTELPALRSLSFISTTCEDFRPLARCPALRGLSVRFPTHWPEITGLEQLQLLETLSLSGNLLVLPPGTVYPHVHTATLSCDPLHLRNARDLPQLPACERLTLSGVERLDGIAAFPRLRNLTLTFKVRSYEPLTALPQLTGFDHTGDEPLDVEPLARVPRLHFLALRTSHSSSIELRPVRDLSPLLRSPSLREIVQTGCPPLALEVAAMNAALPPCDDLFLAPAPRPIPAVARFVVAPQGVFPKLTAEQGGALRGTAPIDLMLRRCEVRWVAGYFERQVTALIGHGDWGTVQTYDVYRQVTVSVECYEVVDRVAAIADVMRRALAHLRHDYAASLHVTLKVPRPEVSDAQAELNRQLRDQRDEADYERRRAEEREALERQYLLLLKQQEGATIDPAEFAAPPRPAEKEEEDSDDEPEEDDDEDEDDEGSVAQKKKPRPNLLDYFLDGQHPLADNYRIYGTVCPDTVWFPIRDRDLAIHFMGRQPDEEIPEEPKTPPQ